MRAYLYPRLYELLTWVDGSPEEKVVVAETALVIDGYPRSGQSFFVGAVRHSNGDKRLATHAHSPRIFEIARDLQVPAICLVRDPRAASASLVQYMPGVSLASALRFYRQYHARLLRTGNYVQIIPFDMATSEPGDTIDAINTRWGTTFERPKGPEWQSEVRTAVVESAANNAGTPDLEKIVALPLGTRRSAEDVWVDASATDLEQLALANKLYEQVLALRH